MYHVNITTGREADDSNTNSYARMSDAMLNAWNFIAQQRDGDGKDIAHPDDPTVLMMRTGARNDGRYPWTLTVTQDR